MTCPMDHSVSDISDVTPTDPAPELARLAYIIDHNIPCFMVGSCTHDDYILSGFARDLRKEHAQVELLWTKIGLDSKQQRHLSGYVRSRQIDLIRLTGMLLCHAGPSGLFMTDASGVLGPYQHVLKVLRELLFFLEDHFQQHLEWDLYVPANYLCIEAYAISCDLKELKVTLAACVLEKSTVKVVESAFATLEQRLAGNITYSQLAYRRHLKELLNRLSVQKRISAARTKSVGQY